MSWPGTISASMPRACSCAAAVCSARSLTLRHQPPDRAEVAVARRAGMIGARRSLRDHAVATGVDQDRARVLVLDQERHDRDVDQLVLRHPTPSARSAPVSPGSASNQPAGPRISPHFSGCRVTVAPSFPPGRGSCTGFASIAACTPVVSVILGRDVLRWCSVMSPRVFLARLWGLDRVRFGGGRFAGH